MSRQKNKSQRPRFPHEMLGSKVSNMDNAKLIQGYVDVFGYYSDQDLVDEFNGLVGHAYSSIWVQALRAALIREFRNRSIDISVIVTEEDGRVISVSYARTMKLVTENDTNKLVGVGRSHRRYYLKNESSN